MNRDYAKYFGEFVKQNGQPRLNDDQFRRFMNIVYQEGKIAGIDCIRGKLMQQANDYRFDLDRHNAGKVLTNLTGNLEAIKLLEEMYKSSKH